MTHFASIVGNLAQPWLLGQTVLGGGKPRPSSIDPGTFVFVLAVVVGVVGAAAVLLHLVNRHLHRWRHNSHPALFYALCRVHGLDRGSRRLLKQISRHHRLAHPARLFVEPGWLEPATLGGAFSSREEDCAALRERIFHTTDTPVE